MCIHSYANCLSHIHKCIPMHTQTCTHTHIPTMPRAQAEEPFTVRACWPVPNLDQFGPASRALHFHWALHLQICQTQLFFLSLSFLSSSSSSSSFHQCKWLLTEWMKMISKASFLLAVLQNYCGRKKRQKSCFSKLVLYAVWPKP